MRRFRESLRRGEPWVWLTGAALALCLLLIVGLICLIASQGLAAFWPARLTEVTLADGTRVLGAVSRTQSFSRTGDTNSIVSGTRSQFKVGNRDLYGSDFRWIEHSRITQWTQPQDALLVERWEYGDFHGRLVSVHPPGPGTPLEQLRQRLPGILALRDRIHAIEVDDIGEASDRIRSAEFRLKKARLRAPGAHLPEEEADIAASKARIEQLKAQVAALTTEAAAPTALFRTADGQDKEIPLLQIVRVFEPNRAGPLQRLAYWGTRAWEYVSAEPREANMEGGVFPAIFGTVLMTLLMALVVTPFGVLAALYLREYARQGLFVRIVRIAVNNLAGVPSIVFGVFGLGFFIYFIGGGIDWLFYRERLPNPTFGTGGILWASLTLAVMTVPVVIVATEEAIAAVPRGLREASLALGASKFQTVCRVVLPGALPGILTGMILAMARGAGEVAPLMITGVVKLAPALALDGAWPFFHAERKFMHLGFHIFDVGFQSPNVEAAKPMVFTTTLLLISVVLLLNVAAIRLRDHVRRKHQGHVL